MGEDPKTSDQGEDPRTSDTNGPEGRVREDIEHEAEGRVREETEHEVQSRVREDTEHETASCVREEDEHEAQSRILRRMMREALPAREALPEREAVPVCEALPEREALPELDGHACAQEKLREFLRLWGHLPRKGVLRREPRRRLPRLPRAGTRVQDAEPVAKG